MFIVLLYILIGVLEEWIEYLEHSDFNAALARKREVHMSKEEDRYGEVQYASER